MIDRPWLMLVTSPFSGLVAAVDSAVAGGVDLVQLRDKSASEADIAAAAIEVAGKIGTRAKLIINGSVQAAIRSGAHGVHLPEAVSEEPYREAREAGLELGASVHSVDAALRSVDLGANYLIAGAIYETPSHPYTEVHGLGFLEAVCRRVEVPVIAIGGIGLARAKDCLAVGASGVAVLSSILYANDPRRTAVEYRRVLDRRESDL